MLSLQYTKQGLFLEQLNSSLESWLMQRFILAVRTGQVLHLSPGYVYLRLPRAIAQVTELELALWLEPHLGVLLYPADVDFVEVNLPGFWLSQAIDAEAGIFVTTLSPAVEQHLLDLWDADRASSTASVTC